MKITFKSIALGAALGINAFAFSNTETARVIEIKVEKIDNATHWMPEKIDVKPGEKITLKASYNLEGGFDFHGLSIPELKIDKKVERNKTVSVDFVVPDKGVTELNINCKFHPAHVGAKMNVKK